MQGGKLFKTMTNKGSLPGSTLVVRAGFFRLSKEFDQASVFVDMLGASRYNIWYQQTMCEDDR